MTRRRLRPDEVELWRKVADTAERLAPNRKGFEPPLPKPKPTKLSGPRSEPFSLDRFETGQIKPGRGGSSLSHDLAPSIQDRVAYAPVRMDRKMHQKMKRGKLVPEGKIDLHGMTQDQAHPRLVSFVLRAHAEGKRMVLVITGKGKHRDEGGPIPVRFGVLRHQVPHWLTTPPLAQVVLQVAEAHVKHGGGGAYYVYLRRSR